MSIQKLCRGGLQFAVRAYTAKVVATAVGAGSGARARLTSVARFGRCDPQCSKGVRGSTLLGQGAALSQVKIRLALEIVVIFGATRLRLGRNSLKLVNHVPRVDPAQTAGLSTEQTAAVAAYLSLAVVRILWWLPIHSSCLVRSLVLLRLLSRWGVDSCLVIGVRYKDDSLAAHAWVEHCGTPLLDSGGGEFARLLQREATAHGHRSTLANTTMDRSKW